MTQIIARNDTDCLMSKEP